VLGNEKVPKKYFDLIFYTERAKAGVTGTKQIAQPEARLRSK